MKEKGDFGLLYKSQHPSELREENRGIDKLTTQVSYAVFFV